MHGHFRSRPYIVNFSNRAKVDLSARTSKIDILTYVSIATAMGKMKLHLVQGYTSGFDTYLGTIV